MGDNVVQVAKRGSPSCVIEEVDAQLQPGTGTPVDEAMAEFGSPQGTTMWNAPTGMALLPLHQAPHVVYPMLHPLVLTSSHAVQLVMAGCGASEQSYRTSYALLLLPKVCSNLPGHFHVGLCFSAACQGSQYEMCLGHSFLACSVLHLYQPGVLFSAVHICCLLSAWLPHGLAHLLPHHLLLSKHDPRSASFHSFRNLPTVKNIFLECVPWSSICGSLEQSAHHICIPTRLADCQRLTSCPNGQHACDVAFLMSWHVFTRSRAQAHASVQQMAA